MASAESPIVVLNDLLENDKLQWNDDDKTYFLDLALRYLAVIGSTEESASQELSSDMSTRFVDSMRKMFDNLIQDLNILADQKSDQGEEKNLLRKQLKLMDDLEKQQILSGRPYYESKYARPGLTRFNWSYPPYVVTKDVFVRLLEPNEISLTEPTNISTYHQFHHYLIYREAYQLSHHRHYDQRGIRLKLYDENYLLLELHIHGLFVNDILLLKCDHYSYYLQAFVHKRIDEGYLIQLDESMHSEEIAGYEFDVFPVFAEARVFCRRCHFAIDEMCYNRSKVWIESLLFPSPKLDHRFAESNVYVQGHQIYGLSWENGQLGLEQRQAVIAILKAEARPAPYILTGPPGTGKLTTMIEAILQIYKLKKYSRILVCDIWRDATIAEQILKAGVVAKEEIWLLAATYRFDKPELSDEVREISAVSNSVTPEMFEKYRIVISTCYQADRVRIYEDMFDYVFISNANRTRELGCLVPIRNLGVDGCVVLVGDKLEASPSCSLKVSDSSRFSMSLLERLSSREPYRCFGEQEGSDMIYDDRYLSILRTNYRSDSRLMYPSADFFYNNRIECKIRTPNWLLDALGQVQNPLMFHPVSQLTTTSLKEIGWNPCQILVCLTYVKRLLLAGMKPQQIGIKAHSVHVHDLDSVIVNNIGEQIDIWSDSSQGLEKEVIIICTKRSSYRAGDSFDEKSFNSSVSRAKWMVIVVGDRNYLESHPFGQTFLKYAQEVV